MRAWLIAMGKTAFSYTLIWIAASVTTHFQGGDFWRWFGLMIPGMLFVAYWTEERTHANAETDH